MQERERERGGVKEKLGEGARKSDREKLGERARESCGAISVPKVTKSNVG